MRSTSSATTLKPIFDKKDITVTATNIPDITEEEKTILVNLIDRTEGMNDKPQSIRTIYGEKGWEEDVIHPKHMGRIIKCYVRAGIIPLQEAGIDTNSKHLLYTKTKLPLFGRKICQ